MTQLKEHPPTTAGVVWRDWQKAAKDINDYSRSADRDLNPGSPSYEVGVIKHRPLRLLGLSSVLNNGVTYLKWPFHSSVVLTAAMSRFKRVVCVCAWKQKRVPKQRVLERDVWKRWSTQLSWLRRRRRGNASEGDTARQLSVWSITRIASARCCWTDVRWTSSWRLWFSIRKNYE